MQREREMGRETRRKIEEEVRKIVARHGVERLWDWLIEATIVFLWFVKCLESHWSFAGRDERELFKEVTGE